MEEQQGQSVQQTLFSLEELTVKNTKSIDQLQEEIKKIREMIKDGYVNNAVYHDLTEKLKERKVAVDGCKLEIDRSSNQAELKQKLKDMQQELREKRQAVSEYAGEYSRLANSNQIEIEGKVYDIVTTAKLVKRGAVR